MKAAASLLLLLGGLAAGAVGVGVALRHLPGTPAAPQPTTPNTTPGTAVPQPAPAPAVQPPAVTPAPAVLPPLTTMPVEPPVLVPAGEPAVKPVGLVVNPLPSLIPTYPGILPIRPITIDEPISTQPVQPIPTSVISQWIEQSGPRLWQRTGGILERSFTA